MIIRISAIALATTLLAGCQPADTDNAAAGNAAEGEAATAAGPVGDAELGPYAEGSSLVTVEANGPGGATYASECAITENSVSGVPVAATLGEFVAAFPVGSRLVFTPNAMVDIGQLCLVTDEEAQVCADFLSYEITEYSPDIELAQVAVYDDQCRTAEGVGPGSTIEQTVAAYGAASFGFNYGNEGREYVAFADAPQAYGFRARSEQTIAMQEEGGIWPNGEFAGDYRGATDDENGEYQTTRFYPASTLWEVTVRPSFGAAESE